MLDRLHPKRNSTVARHPPADATEPAPLNGIREKRTPTDGDLETQTASAADADGWADPYGAAPGFKGWWVLYWHDMLAFVFLGGIALWLLLWSPVPYKKYFLVSSDRSSPSFNVEFAHPKHTQYVPILADAAIAVFTPFVAIFLINILGIGTYCYPGVRLPRAHRRGTFFLQRGSFWNVNNGCMGVVYAVMTGATIQIIFKLGIPGMRPHFLTVCDPQITAETVGEGYGGQYFTISICRDHESRRAEIANALQSFPSGHSVAAWAGLFFLSLYINAHLKVFSNYHPSYWKLLVFVAPLVVATLVVGFLTLDMSHNWYDILVGSLIGVAMAILSYRMCFASVWDFRWNHVPLRRGARGGEEVGFAYSGEEMQEWGGGCATRRAGWGVAASRAAVVGAPGDGALFASGHGAGSASSSSAAAAAAGPII